MDNSRRFDTAEARGIEHIMCSTVGNTGNTKRNWRNYFEHISNGVPTWNKRRFHVIERFGRDWDFRECARGEFFMKEVEYNEIIEAIKKAEQLSARKIVFDGNVKEIRSKWNNSLLWSADEKASRGIANYYLPESFCVVCRLNEVKEAPK